MELSVLYLCNGTFPADCTGNALEEETKNKICRCRWESHCFHSMHSCIGLQQFYTNKKSSYCGFAKLFNVYNFNLHFFIE